MITYVLVLVLGASVANVPVAMPTEAACQKAGREWVEQSAKLRGMLKGDFVCIPVETAS